MAWHEVNLEKLNAKPKITLSKIDSGNKEYDQDIGDLRNQDGMLPSLYGHKMCVVSKNRHHVELNCLGEIIKDSVNEKHPIKHEGIYMFGGV